MYFSTSYANLLRHAAPYITFLSWRGIVTWVRLKKAGQRERGDGKGRWDFTGRYTIKQLEKRKRRIIRMSNSLDLLGLSYIMKSINQFHWGKAHKTFLKTSRSEKHLNTHTELCKQCYLDSLYCRYCAKYERQQNLILTTNSYVHEVR